MENCKKNAVKMIAPPHLFLVDERVAKTGSGGDVPMGLEKKKPPDNRRSTTLDLVMDGDD